MSSIADHVSYFLGTHGPSLTTETACSSSMVALAMAVATLRKGDCDYAIVTAHNIPKFKDFTLSLQVGTTTHPPTYLPHPTPAGGRQAGRQRVAGSDGGAVAAAAAVSLRRAACWT